MYTQLFLCTRPGHMSHAEFRSYWRDIHGPIAKRLPGLEEYVQLDAAEDDAGGWTFDGVALMTFQDQAAAETAWASVEGRATMDDAANFADLGKLIVLNCDPARIV